MGNIQKIDKNGNVIDVLSPVPSGTIKGIAHITGNWFYISRGTIKLELARLEYPELKIVKVVYQGPNPTYQDGHDCATDGKYVYWIRKNNIVAQPVDPVEPVDEQPTEDIFQQGPTCDILKLSKNGDIIRLQNFRSGGLRGIRYDGKHLWVTDIDLDVVYMISVDLKILRQLTPNPETTNRGVSFDRKNLWIAGATNDQLYLVDRKNLNLIKVVGPFGFDTLAVDTDHKYMYVTT